MFQRVRTVPAPGLGTLAAPVGLVAALGVIPAAGGLAATTAPAVMRAAATSPLPGQTGHIDEFRVGVSQTATSDPLAITTGPDGNLWFTDSGASTIGKIAQDFTGLQEFPTNSKRATPVAITTGPDKRLWFTEESSSVDRVGRFDPQAKTSNEFGITTKFSLPTGIVTGPDSNMWFTEFGNGSIGTIHTDGTAEHDFALPGGGVTTTVVHPMAITVGPDNNLWFTEQSVGKIGAMTTAGVLVGEFPPSGGLREVDGITTGPDGNLWFTEKSGNKIGVLTTSGALLHEYNASGNPSAIVNGPDGALWYVEQSGNNIARITTSGAITEYAVPTAGAFSPNVEPTGITVGPDRNIWFTEQDTKAAIARLTVVTSFGLQPSPADFGSQQVGTTSAGKTFTLTSSDALPRLVLSTQITGADSGDFAIVGGSDTCSGIVVSSSCTLKVTFSPTAAGPRTATLSISDTGTGSPHQAQLTGIGLAAGAVALSPSSLDFGDQPIGGSTSAEIALVNNSPSPVNVTSVSIGGANASDFSTSTDGCSGTAVQAGASCLVTISFAPQSAGARSASLTMTDSAANSPQVAQLTGNGVSSSGVGQGSGSIGLSPASFSFGAQAVGSRSPAAVFTLSNGTSASVLVTSDGLDGTGARDFTISNDRCQANSVAPGASCTVAVSFAPFSPGTHTAVLSIQESSSSTPHTAPLTGTGTGAGLGYWEVASDGGIFSFGSAVFYGSTGSIRLNQPIVGMAPTPDRRGYWLVARDGGIFAFGDAKFYGSTGSIHLNKPIVGMASTPDGAGYWLVASDGGIFAFGDARFFGSTGSIHLNKPIVGMASTPDGEGYWLVATDGGIFNYGDAVFLGSTGAIHLNQPIVDMAASVDGNGYLLAASDGGIFTFGDATFRGSAGSIRLNKPIVSMAATGDGGGYWMSATDGGIFNYGDAGFFGSTGSIRLNQPMVGMAPGP